VITHPRPEELTEAVARWIDQIRPQLDPRNAFLARVAANALAAVTRELQTGEAAKTAAAERLAGVLGHPGAYADLTAELCARLRDGDLDAATPGLLVALRANTLDQLAIDQPTYKHEASA
jgi:murein L,D-transpeptidase YcbB/YkuD